MNSDNSIMHFIRGLNMGRKPLSIMKKKVRVVTYLDPQIYSKALFLSKIKKKPLSRLISQLLEEAIEMSPCKAEAVGSNPTRSIAFFSLNMFEKWAKKRHSKKTLHERLSYIQKTPLDLLEKGNIKTYFWRVAQKPINEHLAKALRNLITYLVETQKITPQEAEQLRDMIKIKKSWQPDNYVPNDEQIKNVLRHLEGNHLKTYLILLFSGLRVTELKYVQQAWNNADKFESFVRIPLNAVRNTKKAIFCYIPLWLYEAINHDEIVSSVALKSYLKRRVLLPLKYTRKWFYTKALDLGVPVEIADFYEGRVPQKIGLRHYYNATHRADELYSKVLEPYFREFIKGVFNKDSTKLKIFNGITKNMI